MKLRPLFFSRYTQFLRDAIDEKVMKPMLFQELLRVFITVNQEEKDDTNSAQSAAENDMNTDIAMMGHEWMEMIVRVSGALYRKDEPDGNLGTCVERFLGDMKRNLPRLAQHNPDEYRSHRLYSEDVHHVFDPPGRLKRGEGFENKDILKAIFTCYSMYNLGKKHRKGMKKAAVPVFGMDTWNRLLTDSGFFVVSTMKRQDCKLVFLMSRMQCVDEYQRDKEGQLDFVSFLEALCRLADGHAAGQIQPTFAYGERLHEVLPPFLDILLNGIAKFHRGELRIKAPGSSHDNKMLADMHAYLTEADIQQIAAEDGGYAGGAAQRNVLER